jgi:hypothetical protein
MGGWRSHQNSVDVNNFAGNGCAFDRSFLMESNRREMMD